MKLIFGLGNPGEKYKNNRHNIGFSVLDYFAKDKGLSWKKSKTGKLEYTWLFNKNGKIELIKPSSFMNQSGHSVLYAKKKHRISHDDIYVIHDDLDIRLGEYKIQYGKGPKEHNGLNDIYEKLKTNEFWHIRMGVDNRDTNNRVRGKEYVLEDFNDEEETLLKDVIYEICKKLVIL